MSDTTDAARSTELAAAQGSALRWTKDVPTEPGIYLIADAPNTTPELYSIRRATGGELVLVEEPHGTDSLDCLEDIDVLWYGPIPVPND